MEKLIMDAGHNSPLNSSYHVVQRNPHDHSVNSPAGSDGNHYQSPVISPGNWNTCSPSSNYNTVSPQSYTSFQGTPNSTSSEVRSQPPSTPMYSSHPPALPTELGSQGANRDARMKAQQMHSINKRFMEKSSMDKERERIASRRVQSMMVEATRKSSQSFGKKEANSFLVSNGAEAFATSSRQKKEPMVMEDVKGSVNDFKCGLDLDREWAAKKHALRMITRLDNAA